jgi:hypothetical protein
VERAAGGRGAGRRVTRKIAALAYGIPPQSLGAMVKKAAKG